MADAGWKAQGAAEKYMQMANVMVPGRKEIIAIIARLAASTNTEKPIIMDIGCGLGVITEEILKCSPQASVTMMDFSDEMIGLCRERFKDQHDITIIQQDLNMGLGLKTEKSFDAVVSCFALHHIEFENRIKLYSDIKMVLKDHGMFINGDLFRGDSPAIHEWEFDNYIEWVRQQFSEKLGNEISFSELKARQLDNYKMMGDKPGTIWDMYKDLKLAGFHFVDCLCKYQNLAVIAATN